MRKADACALEHAKSNRHTFGNLGINNHYNSSIAANYIPMYRKFIGLRQRTNNNNKKPHIKADLQRFMLFGEIFMIIIIIVVVVVAVI